MNDYNVVYLRKLRRKTNNKPVFEKHVVFVIVYFTCSPLCKRRPHAGFHRTYATQGHVFANMTKTKNQ